MVSIPIHQQYTQIAVTSSLISLAGPFGLSILTDKNFTSLSQHPFQCLSGWQTSLATSYNQQIFVYKDSFLIWDCKHHIRRVNDLKFNLDGSLLCSCSNDFQLLAWDLKQKSPSIEFGAIKGTGIQKIAWSRLSKDFLVTAHDNSLKVWDTRFPSRSLSTQRTAHIGKVNFLDWHWEQPKKFLSIDILNQIKIWETQPQIQVRNTTQFPSCIKKALFSPIGNMIVLASENDQKLSVLDGQELTIKKTGHIMSEAVLDMAWKKKKLLTLTSEAVNFITLDLMEDPVEDSSSDTDSITNYFIQNDLMRLEQELIQAKKQCKGSGIQIEDIGKNLRYCILRVQNDLHYLRYILRFPDAYPLQPPVFTLKNFTVSVDQDFKALNKHIKDKAALYAKKSQNSIIKLGQILLKRLNTMSSVSQHIIDQFNQDHQQEVESVFQQKSNRAPHFQSIPASSSHVWDTSGKLLTFFSYQCSRKSSSKLEMPSDVYFDDIQNNHFQLGIQQDPNRPEELDSNLLAWNRRRTTSTIQIQKSSLWLLYSPEFAKELILSHKIPLSDLCKVSFRQSNSRTCRKYGFQQSAICWDIFFHSARQFLQLEQWAVHPLGLSLAIKCFNRFIEFSDQVGKLMVSLYCLLLYSKPGYLKFVSNRHWSDINFNQQILQELPVIIPSFQLPCKGEIFLTVKQFAETLLKWEITHKAHQLFQMLTKLDTQPQLVTFNIATPHTFAQHQVIECTHCNLAQLICSICEKVVKGLGMFCEKCHHGGHFLHQKIWFEKSSKCPAGCDCSCLLNMKIE